jgi:hypothetical protein|tara:strand:+ start:829 stop:1227 length:399 start_codon:yes stop_codon:yes gene_type:complete
MDVLTLRTELETHLVNDLGVYTLSNGATTPAISVRAEGESLPAQTTVTGLECIILRDPEPVPVTQYRHQNAFSRWTVRLMDWSGSIVLKDVGEKLLYEYAGSEMELVSVPRDIGPRAQLQLTITANPTPVVP